MNRMIPILCLVAFSAHAQDVEMVLKSDVDALPVQTVKPSPPIICTNITAVDDAYVGDGSAGNVLDNDGGNGTCDLFVSVRVLPEHGTVTLDPKGGIAYSPFGEEFLDSFTYQVWSEENPEVFAIARVTLFDRSAAADPCSDTPMPAECLSSVEPLPCGNVEGEPDWVECVEPFQTYAGRVSGGPYTNGHCPLFHEDTVPADVIAEDGDTLEELVAELNVVTGGTGGVIEIPWDTDTVQCDGLRFKPTLFLAGL